MSKSVVPSALFVYDKIFMNMVDTVFKPQTETETVTVPETNGIHIYICFFRSDDNTYFFDDPRDSVVKLFTGTETKEKMRLKTDERSITINRTTKYYFLRLLKFTDLNEPADLLFKRSKSNDDGDSANSIYGKIYDFILKIFSREDGCIIYAADIDRANELFQKEVKDGSITSANIKKNNVTDTKQKSRIHVDRGIHIKKIEEDKKRAEQTAAENEKKSITRSQDIRTAIDSTQNIDDLRWRVFTIHDIGDILQFKENNKFYPRFSALDIDTPKTEPKTPKTPITELKLLYFDSYDYANSERNNRYLPNMENNKKYNVIDNQVKKIENEFNRSQYPNHNIVDHSSIPQGFSWVTKVNESTSIHVIRLKAFDNYTPLTSTGMYTILLHSDKTRATVRSKYYDVTIETLNLDDTELSTEIKFKKRILTPFIDNNDNLCYFVLNAKDDNEALVYFLRKYGIHYVRSPEENKFTFGFTYFDYINVIDYKHNSNDVLLTFGYNPLTLFSAVSIVHVCLKNDKLLSTDPSLQSNSGDTTPKVLVLSQLTKDEINSASSVYYVVEKETAHRTRPNSKKTSLEKYDFGIIDGFGEKDVVIMHESSWSLGCVQSILDQPECTNYNELNLAAKLYAKLDEKLDATVDNNVFKSYLSNGKFPEGVVSRGSDEYCRLVALEPYGNLFSPDRIIPEPLNSTDIHPVFYVFNASDKASAVIAFNKMLADEIGKVINNTDTSITTAYTLSKHAPNDRKKHDEFYYAIRTVLDENPFFKIFKTYKSYKYMGEAKKPDNASIEPFVKSIIDGTPDQTLLIPINIEIVRPPIKLGGKSSKKRTKKSRRNKVRFNKRATRSNKRKHNNTRKK